MIDMIAARPVNGLAFSVLDLATIAQGRTPADTFEHSLTLDAFAEQWGLYPLLAGGAPNCPVLPAPATSLVDRL